MSNAASPRSWWPTWSDTLAQLEALRTEIIEPHLAKHAGRLFKSVGDGFLIEFASAVQAVICAKAIQGTNAGRRLPLRIGIHVGDVVIQGDDLMGDGVYVAARIEGVAEPGGIAISREVHVQVRDKLDLAFVDKGEIELKNIARPVQIFHIGRTEAPPQPPALPLPDKPSIAVLQFQNMSGDLEQEYFADGMVEDIITALSRTHALPDKTELLSFPDPRCPELGSGLHGLEVFILRWPGENAVGSRACDLCEGG